MVASAGSRSGRAPILVKYDVLEELGHGGMATVYRAHDKRLGRDVAIKALHPHLRESSEIAHRFAVEAKAVAKLRHPNIVEVFDVSSEEEHEQYLVVELVRGPTLRKILQRQGALPPEIGAAIVVELLAGIEHAHAAGVVHRDVKPENVLVEHHTMDEVSPPSIGPVSKRSGERVAIKLTDFGIAKLLDAQGVTSTGQVLGSPAHMAPEQIEGGDVDGRADIFGLGVLFYECVVGHLPFLGNNPAQVLRRVLDGVYALAERERPVVGQPWSRIIDHALARKAEARFADAPSMRTAIEAELGRLGMGPPRVEIETWLDDPEGWTAQHDTRLIARLCELGGESRKRGDAVAAAADYNRALAYSPNDPSLLRVVASMERSEARARLVRRVGPLLLAAGLLGPGAYFVAKAVKGSPVTNDPTAASVDSAKLAGVGSAPPPPSTRPAEAQATGVGARPPSFPATRFPANPTVAPSAKPVTRMHSFASLKPDFGMHMTIDGHPAADPALDLTFPLDNDKPHTLVFSCERDMCLPKSITILPGDPAVPLVVELTVAPAKLSVDGDASHSYGIREFPGRSIAGGGELEVPMMSKGTREVQVSDLTDASIGPQVVLLTAGKTATVSFKNR